jgi:hypothetical protein
LLLLLVWVVLSFCGSPVVASTLNVWLEADQVTSGDYSVRIYASISDPADANSGLNAMAITISTPGTTNVTSPKTNLVGNISPVYNNPDGNWSYVFPALMDFDRDGDNDAVQLCAATGLSCYTGGLLSGPMLIATETWTMNSYQPADLNLSVHPGSRQWDFSNPSAAYQKSYFDSIKATGVHVGPASSGTVTRAPVIGLEPSNSAGVDTLSYDNSNALVGINTDWVNGDPASAGTVAFGDGASGPLTTPLSSYISHNYVLPAGVNIQNYTVNATASNTAGTGSAITTVIVMRHPQIVAKINGQILTDGQTMVIPKGTRVTLSLSESLGYITEYDMWNQNKGWFDQGSTWTGDASTLFGRNLLQIINPGVGSQDTTGVFVTNSMTFTIVPEPASCALLILGGLTALSRRRNR